mmetsp:Transcript_8360/g.30839  ORF Transcript_8360/g.30839 Transcript_8360/m.30839 type:complete len:121 (+) Transcript_8360:1510-1872(+)
MCSQARTRCEHEACVLVTVVSDAQPECGALLQGMAETFGSTCHGAGRAQSRNKSRNKLNYQQVLDNLADAGISIRVASPKLVMEEAPESYKDVTAVVDTCDAAGISKKCVKLRPIAVVKG